MHERQAPPMSGVFHVLVREPGKDMLVSGFRRSPLIKLLGRQGAMHLTGSNTPCLTPRTGIQDAAVTRCAPQVSSPDSFAEPGNAWSTDAQLRCAVS